jgi:hypothetical protein
VLTATPDSDSVLAGWSVSGCGQATTCTVAADTMPLVVDVSFTLTGNAALEP